MSMVHAQPTYRPRHSSPKDRAKSRRKSRPSDRYSSLAVVTVLGITLTHDSVRALIFAGLTLLVASAYVAYQMVPKGTRRKGVDPLPAPPADSSLLPVPLVEPKVLAPEDKNYCLLSESPYGPHHYEQMVYPQPAPPSRPNRALFWGMVATYGAATLLAHRSERTLADARRTQKWADDIVFEGMKKPPWTNE